MLSDLLIIGGGVVGLCLAESALRAGLSVTLCDQSACGSEASWAGVGMLTHRPIPRRHGGCDHHDLSELGVALHAQWAARLKEETGIDPCHRVCGALELIDGDAGLAPAANRVRGCAERNVRAELISGDEARRLEPELAGHVSAAIHFPDEAQVRNPRLLRALFASIQKQGGVLREHSPVADIDFDKSAAAVRGVVLRSGEKISAGAVAVCAGAWVSTFPALAAVVPLAGKVFPMRGQVLCYQTPASLAGRMLTQGRHYLVSRGDGVLLAGATNEQVGFEKGTTTEGLAELQTFAHSVLPTLRNFSPVKHWSGLRPRLKGHCPIFGAAPGVRGLFLALGHYRGGLTVAPATAELLLAIMLGIEPRIPVKNWAPY
jgi:glycine oxidase